MVATPSFKVDIGPSWELMDALVSPCSLRKVLPLRPWLSVSRTATPDLTWPAGPADNENADADHYMGAR